MYAFLAKIGAKVWGYIIAIGAAIGVIFGFYHLARRSGAQGEREKQNLEEMERIDAEAVRKVEQAQEVAAVIEDKVGNANEASNDVNKLNDGDAANKLRDEWARD